MRFISRTEEQWAAYKVMQQIKFKDAEEERFYSEAWDRYIKTKQMRTNRQLKQDAIRRSLYRRHATRTIEWIKKHGMISPMQAMMAAKLNCLHNVVKRKRNWNNLLA